MAEVKTICQGCGCTCTTCNQTQQSSNNNLHLHEEIEILKQQLLESEYHIVQMETKVINHAQKFPNGEFEALKDELLCWQDKYNRLFDSYKKIQKVNQSLENKLLKLVDKFESEKNTLTKDLNDFSSQLTSANLRINELEAQKELFKNDCQIAIQLLQCNPSNFLNHKFDRLPEEMQEKVRHHFDSEQQRSIENTEIPSELIRVPITTFPPSAMVYSAQPKPNPPDVISASILAKVLSERTKETLVKARHTRLKINTGTQTTQSMTNNYFYEFPYVHSTSPNGASSISEI